MSIRGSMYRVIFNLIVIPFVLFSLLITNIYSKKLEKAIVESLHVVADTQVAQMLSFCEQQKEYLVFIGTMDMSHSAMRGELDKEMGRYLDNILYSQAETMSEMNTLSIIDKDYRVVACSIAHNYFADAGLEYLIEKMGERSFYISDVLTDIQDKKTLVAISKIKDGDELLGYVLAELNLDFYKNIREQAELWNNATFYLLDGNQKIISAGTTEENRESFVTTEKERQNYLEKYNTINFEEEPEGSFQYKIAGNDYITYYSDVDYTDWQLKLTVNMDNYQAQKTVYFVLTFFMIVLCIILSVWIGRFASKRIILPVKSISGTLKDIQEKQDYSLRVKVEREDELGSLSVKINEMINFIETENLYKKQQQRLLQEKAEQDALTKVLNKERISQYLQEALEHNRKDRTKMAVLFVDIDDFKAFNTQYGHNVGDQVLLFLTSMLTMGTKGTVGRVGGDEFLVIVEANELLNELDSCLTTIEDEISRRFVMRGSGLHLPVFCSIGAILIDFACTDASDVTLEQLTNLADGAMYQAKNNGKHGHVILEYR